MISFLKKNIFILATIFLLQACGLSAQSQVDSLLSVLGNTRSDSIKVQCYLGLSKSFLAKNMADSSMVYAQKGIALANAIGIKPNFRFYRYQIRANDMKGNYEMAAKLHKPIIDILSESKDPTDLAWLKNYEAWRFFRHGEFTKSIEAFEQTKILAEELENNEILADAYLGLGRVYMSLHDYEMEAMNYIRYLEKIDLNKDRRQTYFILSRLGDIQREAERYDESIETYNKLIKLATASKDSLYVANTLNRLAWGYYEAGRLEESLETYLKDLEISRLIKNKNLIGNCLGNIGNIYRDWNYFEKAIEYYTLSIEMSLEIHDVYNLAWLYRDISAMYANMGRFEKAYNNFMLHAAYNDTLRSDTYRRELLQARNMYELEKTEREMELMQMRLQRNNYLLYGLGGLSLLIVVIALLWIRNNRIRSRERLEAMNHRVSDLTQKNLRSQMNPHFIFNTLNSIQYYVFKNDRIASNDYMTKFAKLIRKTLENSEHPAIPIHEEINALELYLELESLRFKEKFDWKIDIDEDIDTFMYKMPTMLIQPYVENAIGHGLMNKVGTGYIHVSMRLDTDCILCSIEDNGIGRKKAMEIKNNKNDNHRSLGTSITESRLKLVNSLYGKNMKVEYTDMTDEKGEASGTRVVISIPIIT